MTDTISRLTKTKDRVEALLAAFPETRGNDRELERKFYQIFHNVTPYDSFFDVMERKDLTNFETIRRARARIQETNIELRAEKDIEDMRMQEQEGYLEFMGGDN